MFRFCCWIEVSRLGKFWVIRVRVKSCCSGGETDAEATLIMSMDATDASDITSDPGDSEVASETSSNDGAPHFLDSSLEFSNTNQTNDEEFSPPDETSSSSDSDASFPTAKPAKATKPHQPQAQIVNTQIRESGESAIKSAHHEKKRVLG